MSQPAVTAQVRLFADFCGFALFHKKGKTLHLTEEATPLFEYARRIFQWERKIEDAVEETRDLKRGSLRLGTARTYARYFMPSLIHTFHSCHPNVKIRLEEGTSLEMLHSLLDLRAQLAVLARPEDHPRIRFLPFSQEDLLLILSPEHPLAGRKQLSVQELASHPIVMKEAGSGTRKLVDELFARSGCSPNILMETSDAEMIKVLVQHGEGVSFLVKAAVSRDLARKKLVTVPLAGPPMSLEVTIAHLAGGPLSPAARAFLKMTEELSRGQDRLLSLSDLIPPVLAAGP